MMVTHQDFALFDLEPRKPNEYPMSGAFIEGMPLKHDQSKPQLEEQFATLNDQFQAFRTQTEEMQNQVALISPMQNTLTQLATMVEGIQLQLTQAMKHSEHDIGKSKNSINKGSHQYSSLKSTLNLQSINPMSSVKPPILSLPPFNRSNPLDWIFQDELYFNYYQLPPEDRLSTISFYMQGQALSWFMWMYNNRQLTTWDTFVRALEMRFGPSSYDNHRATLFKLRQTEFYLSLAAYFGLSSPKTLSVSGEIQGQNMLKDGDIRSSHSPYSSPVLLVKKNMGHGAFVSTTVLSMPSLLKIDFQSRRWMNYWMSSMVLRYFQRSICASGIASSLSDLLKSQQFRWNERVEGAFKELKDAMTQVPVLAIPDFTVSFKLTTDASGTAIRVVLSQGDHPIAYFSKKLVPRMQAASVYVLQTPEQYKWLIKLMGYDYEIIYKPGKENKVAYALSRVQTCSYVAIITPEFTWLSPLREYFATEPKGMDFIQNMKVDLILGFIVHDGLIYFNGRLYILQRLNSNNNYLLNMIPPHLVDIQATEPH
ncbi:hypothetical protein F3Y22_tig00112069pilonHSYRG00002 [Hibiscus syriacus]|uniref:Reverse transcriptase/retrotransposon-derived protein RNase H-like domain-containing protein n=1 Tax=Hibiscus syriacus TaxID=106335 RepID=A0A6A2X6P2_HIBSY|nr:hypothetical protein F3Y22_tig00112069pilonHSYRG00002 [Hibiscus syriacus]